MDKEKEIENLEKDLEIGLESESELAEELELKIEDKQLESTDEMIELIDIHESESMEEEDEFSDIEFIHQDDKKKKKIKYVINSVVRALVTMIALVAFGYASYELMLVHLENDTTYATKDEIANMFLQDVEGSGGGNIVYNSNGETIVMQNSTDGKAFVWDYEKMLEYNSSAKGYIRQDDGSYIDYPILQHTDNDYYLYHLPDHTWSSMGSIFLDYRIENGLEADYAIVYGHYIGQRANNIMFGSLNWYWDWPYYYQQHPDFDIYVKERHYKYYVFSIMKVPAEGSKVYNPYFGSDEERLQFLQEVKAQSKHEFVEAPELTLDSKVIMLSTCTTDKQVRFVMFLVRGEEIYDVPGVDYNAPTTNSDDKPSSEQNTIPSEDVSSEDATQPPVSDESQQTTQGGEATTTPVTPSETDTTPVTPGDTTPSETPPGETPSSDTPSSETTPGETTPSETTPEETTPEETTPEETTPEETTPEETTPQETTPEESSSSDESSSEETGSEDETVPME